MASEKFILTAGGVMMFKVLIALFVSTMVFCAGMEIVPMPEREYQRSIFASGKSKSQLYKLTLLWVSEAFVSPDDAISFKDEEIGKIVLNYTMTCNPSVNMGASIPARIRLSISVSDSTVKLSYTNWEMYFSATGWSEVKRKAYVDEIKPKIIANAERLEAILKE